MQQQLQQVASLLPSAECTTSTGTAPAAGCLPQYLPGLPAAAALVCTRPSLRICSFKLTKLLQHDSHCGSAKRSTSALEANTAPAHSGP